MRRLTCLVFLTVVGATFPAARVGDASNQWRTEVRDLLARRAQAVARGDEATFIATMAGAPRSFVDAQRTWFRRFRTLPIGSYELLWTDDEFGDLARKRDRVAHLDGVHIIQVRERYAFWGYDKRPADEQIYLTVARHRDRWGVVSDTDVEGLGLKSERHLWHFGEVRHRESGGIMVVYHPAQDSAVGGLLVTAVRARNHARAKWPYPWYDPIVIMMPSTLEELNRIFQAVSPLKDFDAFAASSVDRTTGYFLTGHRVFIHWQKFMSYEPGPQEQLLSHEFTHLATRDLAGPFLSSIFEEGVAQYYGEEYGSKDNPVCPPPSPSETDCRLRFEAQRKHLPRYLLEDWVFELGTTAETNLGYEQAASFCEYLSRSDGNTCARAYQAIGAVPVSAGTSRYHINEVFKRLFGRPIDGIVKGWTEQMYRRLT